MKWNERIVICFKSHALEMNLYVLFDKMRSQFYKYPLAIKLNIPLMPIFMVLSTHPLGATSNSSPRLQKKKRKTNDSMHWHYGFSPVMNSSHIIYISVSKTSQMEIVFRKRMKSNVSRALVLFVFSVLHLWSCNVIDCYNIHWTRKSSTISTQ